MTQLTDRDGALDRLLRALPAEDTGPTDDCLDAEAAAALTDGGLAPGERTACMAHVSTCGHCQALLAALVRTEPLVAPARAWWQMRPWLVPALATGLALTVWIAVERSGPRVTVVPLPPAVTERKEVNRLSRETEARPTLDPPAPNARAGGPTTYSSRRFGPRLDSNAAADQSLPSVTDLPEDLRRELSARANVPVRPSPPRAAGDAPSEQDARASLRRNTVVQVGGATATAPASPPSPPAANESMAAAAPLGAPAKAAASPVAIDIVSSDPRVHWRIAGSAVEHSSDGGTTWTTQATGVSTGLTGGSAPLPEVCWIVGDGGTVVMTVDGLSWTRLPFPVQAPLASVIATSADAATVTTSDGRVFTTVDRGKSWTPR